MMISFLVALVIMMMVLAYLKCNLVIWSASLTVLLLVTAFFLTKLSAGFVILTGLILSILAVLNLRIVRKQLVSRHALNKFRKLLPPLSDTEREAMEAGDVWWDAELFSGNPDWKILLDTPKPMLSPEEQAFLDGPVQTLCNRLDDWQITHHDKDLPKEIWEFIQKEKFFGMIIPKRYGGLEFSALGHSSVVMKIATRSVTAAVTVMVPNSLGPGALLLSYGTEQQKDHYLPRLADGLEIPCFGLTTPDAGSDAGAMQDSGIVCKQDYNGQKDVLGIRLNWEKRYITLGPVATLLGLAFKLYDPDHLIGDEENIGISLALIPADTPGVSIGNRHLPIDIPFQNGPNSGKNVFIPMDWLIGGQQYAGSGWRMLMECLSEGRGVSLPALSAGAAKLASYNTGAYAAIREQFHLPIGRFDGVQQALGRIAGLSYLIESGRTLTLGALDQHISPSVITAIAKYHLTESMRQLINDAMDIHGGKAIMMGPLNYLGRIYQSIPISITVEGANILTRNMIIFGQGATRCHPFILREMQAASLPDEQQALEQFDQLLFQHLGHLISNRVRSFVLGISNARFVKTPIAGAGKPYYQQITRMSAVLALAADVSMALLGGQLKRRETISARLGDVLSYLYLASAALKRFSDQGQQQEDEPLLNWACQYSLYQCQQSLLELYENYPIRFVGRLLRIITFPLGRCYQYPSDQLNHQCAELLLTANPARSRLCDGVFIPDDKNDPLQQLQATFDLVLAAHPLEKKLRDAEKSAQLDANAGMPMIQQAVERKVINQEEADLLTAAQQARQQIIAVDDFAPGEI